MATPPTPSQLLAALKAEGLTVKEYAGWRDRCRCHDGSHEKGERRNSRGWGNLNGTVTHITGGALGGRSVEAYIRDIINGDPATPTKAQLVTAPDGVVWLNSAGRCNHAGKVGSKVQAHLIAADFSTTDDYDDRFRGSAVDGNSFTIGNEVITASKMTAAQYDSAVKVAAAVARLKGWTGQESVGHGEISSARYKVDPGLDMGKFRRDVMARIAKPIAPKPATPAPAPAPAPVKETPVAQPAKPASFAMRLLTINISRYRVGTTDVRGTYSKGLNYAQRIPYIEKIRDKARASMVLTQESGNYAAGKALAKAFPAAFRHFLHGDNGDITQATHWGSDARKLLYEGSAPIGGGRYVVWGIWEDIASGIEFLVGNLHPDYVRGNDALRQSQTAAAVKVCEEKADGRPQIIGGDLNDDKDDAFDGPGRALKAAGFRDTEVEAKTKKNLDKGTLNGLTPGLQAGRRYDRFWVKDGKNHTVKVNEIDTLDGYPATDHNAVVISVTITAK